MLTNPTGTTSPTSAPLTHRQCLTAGATTPAGRDNQTMPWVQVRRYHPEGAYVLCGRLAELRENGREWFKVDTDTGPVWAEGKNVRLCSGDGRCTCDQANTNGGH